MLRSRLRHSLKLFVLAVVSISLTLSLVSTPVSAATKVADMSPEDAAKAFVYYKALRTCLTTTQPQLKNYVPGVLHAPQIGIKTDGRSMSAADAESRSWFYDGAGALIETDVGVYGDPRPDGDGRHRCYGDEEGKRFIGELLSLTGYGQDGGPSFLCDIGFTRETPAGDCATIIPGANNDFLLPTDVGGKLDAWWTGTIGATSLNALGIGPGAYVLYLQSFLKGCQAVKGTGSTEFNVILPDGSKMDTVPTTYVPADRDVNGGTSVRIYSQNARTCSDLAAQIDELTDPAVRAYHAYLIAGGTPLDPGDQSGTGSDETTSTCVIDSVGWIVCGMAEFLANVTDGIYGIIENFLRTPAINVDTASGDNGVYNAWVVMRTIANVAFVIGFLIIIFSQLTGLGVTNYGIKKTLPRLVVAAILVNISYWVAAIAVDLSNIFGAGIYDVMNNVRQSMNISISSNWGASLTALLGGGALAVTGGAVVAVGATAIAAVASTGGTGIMALVFLALPLVLGAVLAVFILVFILIARQALIIILLIVSPLAFVALLLPNTEQLFTKWRQTLVSLLLMYPIVSLIFGGAQIAGLAILASADGIGASSIENALRGGILILTGQFVIVAPFFFLPMILTKFSGGNLDKLAANLKSSANRLTSKVGKASGVAGVAMLGRSFGMMKRGYSPTARYGKNGKEKLSSRIRRGGASAGNAIGTIGSSYDQGQAKYKLMDEYLKDVGGEAARERLYDEDGKPTEYALSATGGDVGAARALATRARAKAEAEQRAKAAEPLKREIAQWRASGEDVDAKLEERARVAVGAGSEYSESDVSAALHELGAQGRDKVLRRLQGHYSGDAARTRLLEEAKQANFSALGGKAPDLIKPASTAFGNVSAPELQTFSEDTSRAYVEYIATLTPGSDEFKQAVSAFNNALQQISSNPNFVLKQDAGRKIRETTAKLPPAVATAIQQGVDLIDASGNIIRP